MNDYFKQGFEKIANVVMKKIVKKFLSPKQLKIQQPIKKMRVAGISDDQIRATADKVRARQAAAAQAAPKPVPQAQGNVLDYRQLKKEYVAKKNTPSYKAPAPSKELSLHAQNKMQKMTPRSVARKAGLGTNFNPTPINPNQTRKPF
jgi:hypothetical protein